MADNLKDILSHLNKDIEQDKLLRYLNNELTAEERHNLEKQMNDDAFINDAVEGLEDVKNKENIPRLINDLQAGLKKQLDKKKKRKEKRKLREHSWIYYTIIILLILIITAYIVIKKIV